jgi:hypothetical protein
MFSGVPIGAPDPLARWLRVIAATVAVVGAVVLGVAVLQADPPKLTAKALAASVEEETGSASAVQPGVCSRRGPHAWSCVVADAGGSGVASYAVTVDSERCWRARRKGAHPRAMPKTAMGCAHLE